MLSEQKMENIINKENDFTIALGKETGKIMFQFGDDEPNELGIIHNYSPLTLILQQNKKNETNNVFTVNTPSVEFVSKCGKKFKLFIQDIEQ